MLNILALGADNVVVGRFYIVPCIQLPTPMMGYKIGDFCPIISPLHSDEILRFPYDHYHYDLRFVPRARYDKYLPSFWASTAVMRYLSICDSGYSTLGEVDPRWIGLQIQSRKFKCHRQMPCYPFIPSGIGRLEESMQQQKMCDRICPHKGVSLSGIPVDSNDQIVCPGHGLRWNNKTGDLIKTSHA